MWATGGQPPKLIGRDKEFGRVIERLSAAAAGRGSIVLVSGSSGTGKSRLIQSLLQKARSGGLPIAYAENYSHVRAPFGPFTDLLRELMSGSPQLVPKAQSDRLLLERLIGIASDAGNPSEWDKRRLFVIIRDALTRVAIQKPLVIAIDDIQWADPESIELLHFLGSRMNEIPVLVALGLRDDEDNLSSTSADLAASLGRFPMTTIVEMGPLSEKAVRELVAARTAPDQIVTRRIVDEICRLADGNPFIVEELLRDVKVNANVATMPHSVRQIARKRLAALDESHVRLIEIAAALGRSFRLNDLVDVSRSDEAKVMRTLRLARDSGVIRDADRPGDTYMFRHELLRSAIYADILSADRKALHRQIAERYESGSESLMDSATLAYHWRGAGDVERATRYSELAGDMAAKLTAYGSARDHYLEARNSDGPDAATQARLDEKLGNAFDALGNAVAAVEHFERAINYHRAHACHADTMRIELRFAETAYRCGRIVDAIAACNRILDGDSSSSSLRFAARVALATFYAYLPDITVAEQQIVLADQEPCEHAEIDRIRLEWARAVVAADRNDIETSCLTANLAVELAELHGTPSVKAYTLMNFASLMGQLGRRELAEPALNKAILIADDNALTLASAYARCTRADLAHFHGQLNDARRMVLDVSALHVDAFVVRVYASAVAQFVLADIGAGEDLPRFSSDALLDAAFGTGEALRFAPLAAAHAHVAAMLGDLQSARRIIRRALQDLRPGPSIGDALYTFARFGERAEVEHVRTLFFDSNESRRKLPQLMVEAIWQRWIGESGEAKSLFSKAEILAFRLEAPLYRAAALEELERRVEAIEIYEKIGALAHVQRLKTRRSGVLTRREEQIAALIGEGISNRAIAQRLVLSERTVESHVAAIYGKLGVNSRAEFITRKYYVTGPAVTGHISPRDRDTGDLR